MLHAIELLPIQSEKVQSRKYGKQYHFHNSQLFQVHLKFHVWNIVVCVHVDKFVVSANDCEI